MPVIYLTVLIMLPYFINYKSFESRRRRRRGNRNKNPIIVILLVILGIIILPLSFVGSILGAIINLCIIIYHKCKRKKSIPHRVPITVEEREIIERGDFETQRHDEIIMIVDQCRDAPINRMDEEAPRSREDRE